MNNDGKIDLVIVGSVALDTIETPYAKQEKVLGGSVTYACAAASFSKSTAPCSPFLMTT